MFSQVCVKNSVHGWVCMIEGMYGREGAYMAGVVHGRGGVRGREGWVARETSTAVDSTHPTGMPSLLI